jgi:hypothetical protein
MTVALFNNNHEIPKKIKMSERSTNFPTKEYFMRGVRLYKKQSSSKPGALNHFPPTSTTAVLLFASEHRHKMSTGTSTVYIFVKEHYSVSKDHQAGNPC